MKINNKKLEKSILLISGGVDSMFLLFYFHNILNVSEFIVLHINYKTRGIENQIEEENIRTFCKTNNIKCEVFNYKRNEQVQNFQEDARIFRYDKALELCKKYNFKNICSAHNLNDKIETYFIKKIQKRDKVKLTISVESKLKDINLIRPILHISKNEIYELAEENNIIWNEDSSNITNKYLRNRIRRKIENLNDKQLNNLSRKIDMKSNNIQRNKEYDYLIKNNIVPTNGMIKSLEQLSRKGNDLSSIQINNKIFKKVKNEIIVINARNEKYQHTSNDLIINYKSLSILNPNENKVIIRSRKSGDYILKKEGKRSLKRELINKKIYKELRDHLIVIEINNEIVYVENLYKNDTHIITMLK